jgi:hypothetical protein
MAGEHNVVEAVVRARHEAAGSFNAFLADLDRVGRESEKAGKGVRNLVAPLAFELAPALGTTGGRTHGGSGTSCSSAPARASIIAASPTTLPCRARHTHECSSRMRRAGRRGCRG